MAIKRLLLVLIFTFVGCGKGAHMPLPKAPEIPEFGESVSYKKDLLPVFAAKCAQCHNSRSPTNQPNWLDYKTAVNYKTQLLNRIWIARDMPPNKDLSEKSRAMIAKWVKSGTPEDGLVSETQPSQTKIAESGRVPITGPSKEDAKNKTGLRPPIKRDVSYQKNLLPIFKSECASCHNSTSPRSRPNWLDYKTALAHKSELYNRIWVVRDMPPKKPLSEENRALIASWTKSETLENKLKNKITKSTPLPTATPSLIGEKGKIGTDPVSRGQYLTRAADCLSCHTSQGSSAVGAGGRIMKTSFGTLETPNITPDVETGIGSWTADEFYNALHNGIGKNGEYYYPAFPFTSFTKMTRRDVDAIFAYLKTLQPVHNVVDVDQLKFPYRNRHTLSLWRALYFNEGTFVPDPSRNRSWNRGAYLVTAIAHCAECHSPRNFMGAIEKDDEFTGGEVDQWYASNLTYGARNGITEWSEEDLAQFLGTGSVPGKATAVGPMADVVFNSLTYLSSSDLQAIAAYMKSRSLPSFQNVEKLEMDKAHLEGVKLYSQNCMSCHQASGTGKPDVYPPLSGNPLISEENPSNLVNTIILGIPQRSGFDAMPSFANKLTDQEIADIANYVRFRFGFAKPNVTKEMVSKKRQSLFGN